LENKTKRIISIILVIVTICCVVPFACADEYNYNPYLLSDNGTLREGSCPTTGNAGVLTIVVTFKNLEPVDKTSIEEINKEIYSATYDYNIPVEKIATTDDSLHSFYYRQSFGKLNIVGKAFDYTTQNDYTYYLEDSGTYMSPDEVINEAIEYYTNTGEFNFNDYDKNNDGFIDSVILYARNVMVDGKFLAYIGSCCNCYPAYSLFNFRYIANVFYINNRNEYINQHDNIALYHEFLHTFGFRDVYGGTGVNPSPNSGSSGTVSSTIHESNGTNGISAPHKIILGWVDAKELDYGEFELGSSTTDDTVYVLNIEGQQFVVEYCGKKNNRNKWYLAEDNNELNGLRVWKVKYADDPYDGSECWIQPFYYLINISGCSDTEASYNANYRSVVELVNEGEYISLNYSTSFTKTSNSTTPNDCVYSGYSITVRDTTDTSCVVVVKDTAPKTLNIFEKIIEFFKKIFSFLSINK